ncbi:MAG: hypothetical protein F2866_04270 [Actinobacteria bacterium]|uniref:Unannotated protein n=2 Tax=freshwater metagenome TaxID=449393 RepID=A0A6J5ZQI0_9ZZZZ|nr:hypothetical protein [Actinomycetota bacterium]MSW24765.1 hypothetical protein [Actinomycetota bacterium]MSX30020.1 hypothetical protein [Actinomycetota bacterium]MSX43466.1 hypothetical protein [Actinomycetota bacterium]MSX97494.1 hypothetical protein [Actinomycetota bacterium]
MTFHEYLAQWSRLHGSAAPKGLVRIWLRIAYSCATPFIRVNPNLITISAVVPMVIAIYLVTLTNPRFGVASALVLLVGFIDNFDGIVAVRTNRETKWGAFLDAIVDRIVDVCIGLLFIVIGAPLEIGILAISFALVHEYMRARAGGLGHHEVATITAAEKPTRIALGVMFLLASAIYPTSAIELATFATVTWAVVGLIGFAQLMRGYRKLLKQ